MALSDWALPAVVGGLFLLIREVKSIELPSFDIDLSNLQIKGTREALIERTESLQEYEAERYTAAEDIESKRAVKQLIVGNYGTVVGPAGAYTGTWQKTIGKAGDSCHVIRAGPASSAGWKMFTGAYCRQARAQGFIE